MPEVAPSLAGLIVTCASVGIGVILMGYAQRAVQHVRVRAQDRNQSHRSE